MSQLYNTSDYYFSSDYELNILLDFEKFSNIHLQFLRYEEYQSPHEIATSPDFHHILLGSKADIALKVLPITQKGLRTTKMSHPLLHLETQLYVQNPGISERQWTVFFQVLIVQKYSKYIL